MLRCGIVINYSDRVPFSRFPHRNITLIRGKTNKSYTVRNIGLLRTESDNKYRRMYETCLGMAAAPLFAFRVRSRISGCMHALT